MLNEVTVNWWSLQDSIWEKMPQEGNKAEYFINETQFLHLSLAKVPSAPAKVSIEHLQHIAQLRVTLTMAAQFISDRLSGEVSLHYCI